MTINLRAEADPERLESAVRQALQGESDVRGVALSVRHLERFRPGRPVPTYRMAGAG